MVETKLIDARKLTDQELERALGWRPGSAAVLRCRGALPIPHMKIGRRVRYLAADVETYLVSTIKQPKK